MIPSLDNSSKILNSNHLDCLVSSLHQAYGFDKSEDTYEAIATVILHAPPDMGEFSLEYVGSRVSKMIANKVAYEKLQELKDKRKQAETPKEDSASGPKPV